MQVDDLNRVAQAGLIALVLSGLTLVSTAATLAADLPPYFADQEAVLTTGLTPVSEDPKTGHGDRWLTLSQHFRLKPPPAPRPW